MTYPRAAKTRRAAAALPLSALLLETDAPDMPLCGFQGQRNSPLQLPRVAQALAGLRGVPVDDIARQTVENSLLLFER
ncbi:MAG: TatD family hydrolase [Exilibacterium sp.]